MRLSSDRFTRAPVYRSPTSCTAISSSSVPDGHVMTGGTEHAFDDALVAGATTDVPGQRLTDLRLVGIGCLGEQRRDLHDEARRAEAALEAVALPQRVLQ